MTKDSLFAIAAKPLRPSLLLSCLLLVSCSSGDFPAERTETLVAQQQVGSCKLARITERKPLSSVEALARMAVHYEADCLPDGGTQARRLRYVMTFSQRDGWLGKSWIMTDNQIEADPLPAPATAATTATAPGAAESSATPWSDAPECNAALTRVAAEVVPCLQQADPATAQEMQDWLQRARYDYRLHGDVSQREAALLKMDEECLYQWKQRNRILQGEAALRRCALN